MNDTKERINKMIKKSEVILNAGKPKPQTNEEWRKTCSTEEYAAWLWKHFAPGDVIILWEKYGSPMYKDDNGVSRADYTEAMKKWLKENHNEIRNN